MTARKAPRQPLKACPYCESTVCVVIRYQGVDATPGERVYRVECDNCGTTGPYGTFPTAAGGWNSMARYLQLEDLKRTCTRLRRNLATAARRGAGSTP